MAFHTWEFLIFFLPVLLLYFGLALPWQNFLLLAASYFFFAWMDPRVLIPLLAVTLATYFLAIAIHRSAGSLKRNAILAVCIGADLGILLFFKYQSFAWNSIFDRPAFRILKYSSPWAQIALPLGISFYTLQALAYAIDVCKNRIAPERNFLNFALFLSFFPKGPAGPIEPPQEFLAQTETERTVTSEKIRSGTFLIFLGLFKKLAIADPIAVITDNCFLDPGHFVSSDLLIALYLFSIRIYADFSGYSDMARGIAKWFGFDLLENFRQPYLSGSFSGFFSRWHISFTQWMRKYIYDPLASGRSTAAKAFLLIFAGVLAGAWHGLTWNFLAWGFALGMFLGIEKWIRSFSPPWNAPSPALQKILRWAGILLVFHCLTFSWILFRCPDLQTSWNYVIGFCTPGLIRSCMGLRVFKILIFGFPLLLLDWLQTRSGNNSNFVLPYSLKIPLYAGMLLLIYILSPQENVPFLYFQF